MIFSTICDLALEKKKTVKKMGKEKQCVDLVYFWLGKYDSPSVVVPFNLKLSIPTRIIDHSSSISSSEFLQKSVKINLLVARKKMRKLERETLSLTFETNGYNLCFFLLSFLPMIRSPTYRE